MSALQWTWVAMLPMLSGALLAALAISIRPHRREPLGKAFLIFLGGASIWTWAYMAELCATRLDVGLFWANVEYIGIPITPAAFFLFTYILTGGSPNDRRLWIALGIQCLAITVLAWTDGYHHLLRDAPRFVAYGTYRVVVFRPGPGYMAMLAFCYLQILISIIRLVAMARRRDSMSRKHAQIILAGLVLPVFGNVSRIFGYEPLPGIDQTPIFFAITAGAVAYGVFRWSLISVAPVARERVVDGLSDAVVVVDPNGRVIDTNPAAAGMFGLTEDELSRTTLDSLSASLPPGAISGEREDPFEVGGRFFRLRRTILTGAGGAVMGNLLQFTDVTEQRHTEAVLRRAKEMAEEASAAKSRFVAHVSHELRTPLNGVIGLAGLLGNTNLNPTQKEYVGGIVQCSETLLGLVSDVLDLSRLEAGAMPVASEPVDVTRLIREIAQIHSHVTKPRGVELAVDVRGLPRYVASDPLRLRQILNNLIGNAVKFTEHGTIRVSARNLGDGQMEIVVADTGMGIPEDKQATVLEPFQQADTSTTRKFGGTGLGLPITVNLVQRLGGTMTLASTAEVGTTITVRLPLAEADAPEIANDPAEVPAGLRVLVAEDNEVNALVIISLLEGFSCVVDHRENGVEALSAFERNEYDLLLLDIQMPLMDGLQLTREIRARWPQRHTPIFALTANAMDEERRNALEAGMNGFLTKPVRLPELADTLRNAAPV